MPGGADRPYPAAHAPLLEAIAERGRVVSEAPPGAAPTRTRFLARNRITAALAEGTVVVEGAVRSGALNTAHWTATLQRPVMGVPGPVTSAASAGVNQLIRRGSATAVANAQDVITDVMCTSAGRSPNSCNAGRMNFSKKDMKHHSLRQMETKPCCKRRDQAPGARRRR